MRALFGRFRQVADGLAVSAMMPRCRRRGCIIHFILIPVATFKPDLAGVPALVITSTVVEPPLYPARPLSTHHSYSPPIEEYVGKKVVLDEVPHFQQARRCWPPSSAIDYEHLRAHGKAP
ncbi:hypothetical protein K438DRAFT_1991930 [Mycena galopus ATCC 62051]|nr:hypothetical protein K438DRAFT_1991930 [Mycena galopus ATCC 62051]